MLETGEIQKIGSEKTILSNARIVAATNKDLLQLVKEGQFRQDLYYRLNVFPITIPSIRDRMYDIEPLAHYFLDGFNRKYRTSKMLHRSAIDTMKTYSWPGNIREIRNIIERLVISSTSDVLMSADLAITKTIESEAGHSDQKNEFLRGYEILPLKEVMRNFEEEYVQRAIDICGGDVALASDKLGMHKSGIYRKLDEFRRSKN